MLEAIFSSTCFVTYLVTFCGTKYNVLSFWSVWNVFSRVVGVPRIFPQVDLNQWEGHFHQWNELTNQKMYEIKCITVSDWSLQHQQSLQQTLCTHWNHNGSTSYFFLNHNILSLNMYINFGCVLRCSASIGFKTGVGKPVVFPKLVTWVWVW